MEEIKMEKRSVYAIIGSEDLFIDIFYKKEDAIENAKQFENVKVEEYLKPLDWIAKIFLYHECIDIEFENEECVGIIYESNVIEKELIEYVDFYKGSYVKAHFEDFEKCEYIDVHAPSPLVMKKECIKDNELYAIRYDSYCKCLYLLEYCE
jgi:hypothetical protein